MLRGKTLEEIVNRWSSDLETHAREFNRFAAEVAVWDRALIENGNNVRCRLTLDAYTQQTSYSVTYLAFCAVQPYYRCRTPAG
jgi:nuclear pore complex protein Nup62